MLELCDCTNDCGDCPGISRGTHSPCDFKKDNDMRIDRQRRADVLIKQMGFSDALEAMELVKSILLLQLSEHQPTIMKPYTLSGVE